MATIEIHPLKGNVQNAINYVISRKKTNEFICESKNCNMYCAGIEWDLKHNKGKNRKSSMRDDVVGWHFHQNFAIGTVTPEKAFEISKEWIEKITQGNYDYVIATHTDKKHIHSHIILCPYNNVTNKKIDIFMKRDLPLFKKLSDDICKQHGLDILDPVNIEFEKSYYAWTQKNKGDSNREIIRKTIENLITKVKDYNEFKEYITKLGFKIEDGTELENNRKGLRIKTPNGKSFIRCNRITDDQGQQPYSLESIIERIENNGIFVTLPEVNEFLTSKFNKTELKNRRMSFYEDSNIKLSFLESAYSKMTNFEKMVFAKKKNIDQLLNDIHEMNLKTYGLKNLSKLKSNRSELQSRIDDVNKQLHLSETKLSEIINDKMEGNLLITEEQLDNFIQERITPLRDEKESLKKEISSLSEIINKTETAIYKKKER